METGDACAGLLGTFRSQHVLLLVLSCIKHVGLSFPYLQLADLRSALLSAGSAHDPKVSETLHAGALVHRLGRNASSCSGHFSPTVARR